MRSKKRAFGTTQLSTLPLTMAEVVFTVETITPTGNY